MVFASVSQESWSSFHEKYASDDYRASKMHLLDRERLLRRRNASSNRGNRVMHVLHVLTCCQFNCGGRNSSAQRRRQQQQARQFQRGTASSRLRSDCCYYERRQQQQQQQQRPPSVYEGDDGLGFDFNHPFSHRTV